MWRREVVTYIVTRVKLSQWSRSYWISRQYEIIIITVFKYLKKKHEHEERNGTYLKEADGIFRDKNRSNFPEWY